MLSCTYECLKCSVFLHVILKLRYGSVIGYAIFKPVMLYLTYQSVMGSVLFLPVILFKCQGELCFLYF